MTTKLPLEWIKLWMPIIKNAHTPTYPISACIRKVQESFLSQDFDEFFVIFKESNWELSGVVFLLLFHRTVFILCILFFQY